MRSGGQKRSRKVRPSYKVENEFNPDTVPQFFQVSVNVLEARKLAWPNSSSQNSYVIVVIGKDTRRTSIRKNATEPSFGEFFVFEIFASIRDMQRSSLWLAVMEPRFCAHPRLLGEVTINLGAIWSQPHHQIVQKWAQLGLLRDPEAGPLGFLKVDISIVFRGEVHTVIQPRVSNENVADNLLLPSGTEQQPANYIITIYGALGLAPYLQASGKADKYVGKQPSVFVRTSFCGLQIETAVHHRNSNPILCEQVSIVEMFPNMNQLIRFEVCSVDKCFHKVIAATDLKLNSISHDGENGFVPTFGPSLLHMYATTNNGVIISRDEDAPYHRGALLLSVRAIVPFCQRACRSIDIEPIPPIDMETLWTHEDFCIYAPVLEVSMLDPLLLENACGVAITIAGIACENKSPEDIVNLKKQLQIHKLHFTGMLTVRKSKGAYGYTYFPNTFPILQAAIRLPDFRFRMYRSNLMRSIVTNLELTVLDIERRLKYFKYNTPKDLKEELNIAIDDATGKIMKFLDIVNHSSQTKSNETLQQNTTELDEKLLALQKQEIEKIYQEIYKKHSHESTIVTFEDGCKMPEEHLIETRKEIKNLLAEAKTFLLQLKSCVFEINHGWPDIVVWLLNGNGSRVAYSRISPADVIFSIIPEQCGMNCGRLQCIYLKPLRCPRHCSNISPGCQCIAARVEMQVWMGLFRQKCSFDSFIPPGYIVKTNTVGGMFFRTNTMLLECRAFIYRAKIIGCGENYKTVDPFVRINALKSAKDTKVIQKSLLPVWNQVVIIQKLTFINRERLANCPPVIIAEVYDGSPTGKLDLVGRTAVHPIYIDTNDYTYEQAPKLQWYDIHKGTECTGQILMSAQLVTLPERLIKASQYEIDDGSNTEYPKDSTKGLIETVEPIPEHIIPKTDSYKVDIYWWGLRDVHITRKPCVMLEIDTLSVKSEIIANMKCNSNFPNGKTSHTFVSSLNELYSPLMSIRLYDSSTFGRTMYLETSVIKNPNKYMMKWLPKNDRDACLKSNCIMMCGDFREGDRLVCVKSDDDNFSGESITRYNQSMQPLSSLSESSPKRTDWKTLFTRSKVNEEESYLLLPLGPSKGNHALSVLRKSVLDLDDWWSRFYYSQTANEALELAPTNLITVYHSELELQSEFSKFKDWCSTLKLYNGEKTGIPEKDAQLQCGCLKAGIAIYQWPPPEKTVAVSSTGVELTNGFFDEHPSNEPTKILVRVYVVQALNLCAKAFTGTSDPYVVVSCGKRHLGDRNTYIPNTVDPVFGKMFELRCTLPEDYLLTVSLYDYDAIPPDNLIGITSIDLEDRLYTKHRATVGLSSEYTKIGTARWRDCMKPSQILEELCLRNHLPPPEYPNHYTVVVNGIEYKDNSAKQSSKRFVTCFEERENICLNLLRSWQTLPICGYHLVPEHVETRTLRNPDYPGSSQGKLQMWVDIFPIDNITHIPPPYEIAPRKSQKYELRVIIWSVRATHKNKCPKTNKTSTPPLQKPMNLYVRAWIGCVEHAQHTDIHYNCVDGNGEFNWRMIFRFDFQHANRKIVSGETSVFTEYEEFTTPFLVIQLLESDSEELLGSLAVDLNCMPCGCKTERSCTLSAISNCRKMSLFKKHSVRAWWPLKMMDTTSNNEILTGAIDIELILLPYEEACTMPVGLGRYPPVPLPVPKRRPPPMKDSPTTFFEFKRDKMLIVVGLGLTAVSFLVFISITALPAVFGK